MKNKILAKNIHQAAGGHGLKLEELEHCLDKIDKKYIDLLAYTLTKAAELDPTNAFSTVPIQIDKPAIAFTKWHHIESKWNSSWGFNKNHPGCYIYGLFKDNKPDNTSPANYLDPNVIYIGESRSVKRNSMLGRRNDFKCTVKGNLLSPYGCGTAFKNIYGPDNLQYTYQAYMPIHQSWTKSIELELLSNYYNTHNKIPPLNPPSDQKKSQNYQKNFSYINIQYNNDG
jgi:hypothetical protein